MMRAAAILLVLALGGCATAPTTGACPAGKMSLRTAQLFLGQSGRPVMSELAFRKFVREELAPRFPDGLTVLDGGAEWKGADERLIHNAAKIVLIVLPATGDASPKLAAVRAAYRQRFHQGSVLQLTGGTCIDA